MYTLQTFIGLDREIDNDPMVIAPLGELSTLSRTFARDVTTHQDDAIADMRAHVFSSRQDDTEVSLRSQVLDAVFTVADYLYTRAKGGLTTDDSAATLANLEADLGGAYADWTVGDMVNNGTMWMPEYVIASLTGEVEDTFIRVFFSDTAFQQRYDQYHITVVHPVDNIDDLHGPLASLQTQADELDMAAVFDRLESAAQPYPYTLSKSFEFKVVDVNDPSQYVTLPWVVAIYGRAGDNLDAIYSAIRASILDQSALPSEDWEDRIPDLFKTVEFTVVPYWDQYAVPNQTIEAGLYSPLMRLREAFDIAKAHMPLYATAHVQSHTDLSAYLYKSLAFSICGGPENRGALYDLRSFFPDYALLSTTSLDFNRLSPETRGFVHRLAEQFRLAESAGEFTLLPSGYSKVWRENKLYIVSNYQNIQFYVLAKLSYVGVI